MVVFQEAWVKSNQFISMRAARGNGGNNISITIFFFFKMLNLRVKLLTTHLIFQTFAKLRFDQSHIYACVSTT